VLLFPLYSLLLFTGYFDLMNIKILMGEKLFINTNYIKIACAGLNWKPLLIKMKVYVKFISVKDLKLDIKR